MVDNHTHILFASIESMVAGARQNKLTEYSVTEHVSQFEEPRNIFGFGSVHDRGRIFQSLSEYRAEFGKVDCSSPNLKVHCGLEVDFSPRYEKGVGDFVNQEEWEILLCSVHEFLDGTSIEKKVARTPSLTAKLWQDYIQLETLALESDFIPFHVLSHPVRLFHTARISPPDLKDQLLDLARTAKRRGKALELNGNDIDQAPELVRSLAVASSRAGCPVSLGSDAHRPEEVARNVGRCMSLVDELKLQLVRI